MRIDEIMPDAAARLVPLNAIVQRLHAAERPDIFRPDPHPLDVEALFRDLLQRPTHFALVAVAEDGTDIGYALCEILDTAPDALTFARRRGVLHHIAVQPHARRQGVGLALIAASVERFRGGGAKEWTTSYHSFNTASAALMRKAGLTVTILRAEARL